MHCTVEKRIKLSEVKLLTVIIDIICILLKLSRNFCRIQRVRECRRWYKRFITRNLSSVQCLTSPYIRCPLNRYLTILINFLTSEKVSPIGDMCPGPSSPATAVDS